MILHALYLKHVCRNHFQAVMSVNISFALIVDRKWLW